MLSLDLFDSRFEKKLHEGAVDDAEYARLKKLGEKIDYLKQARAKTKDPEMHLAIDRRIEQYDNERQEILSVRGMKEAQQPQQPPAQGLLKGKDLVTPQQRVAGATPQKPGMMGAVKDVVGGIKRFVKGEPDQGPTYEQEEPLKPTLSPQLQSVTELIAAWDSEQEYIDLPLADGSSVPVTRPAIFNALIALKQIQTNRPKKYLDYVNKNLSDKDTFFRWLANIPRYKTPPKKKKNVQPGLPMTPPPVTTPQASADAEGQTVAPAGPMVSPEFRKEAGLSERKIQKKKSKDDNVLDVRLNRELQKARARFPTAKSDLEALALDQMTANDQQDDIIKGLEQEIARVKSQNQSLSQTVQNFSNKIVQAPTKPSVVATPVVPTVVDKRVQPAAGVDQKVPTPTTVPVPEPIGAPVSVEPTAKTAGKAVSKAKKPRVKKLPSKDMGPAVQVGIDQDFPELPSPDAGFDFGTLSATQLATQAIKKAKGTAEKTKRKTKEPVTVGEHGGGIGPRQHWQDLMPEGWSDKYNPTPYAVYIDGRQWKEFRTDEEARRVADKVQANLKQQGRDQTVTIAPSQAYLKGKNVKEGQDNKLALASKEFIQGVYDPTGPVYRAAYRSFQKGQQAEAILRKHIAQKYGISEKDLVDAMSNHMARQLAGRRYKKQHSMDEQFDMPGTTVPRKSVIQGYTVFYNPTTKTVSVTRGGESEEAAIEQARMGTVNLKNFRQTAERLIDRIESDDQLINEGIKDASAATAVIACLLTGGSLTGCATAPQKTSAQQVLKTGQDLGRTVQTAQRITRAGLEAEVNQEIRNLLRGIGGRPEELNNSNILRIWRRIKGVPPVQPEPQAPEYGPADPAKRTPQYEAREIHTQDDFVQERDRLLRMITQETNPANRQILRSAIKQLENRAEAEGWIAMQQRMIREDTAALAAEDAILKRIFVRHKDLMMEYGPDKITQAAESVAYNVGDIAHITDEQITEWIGQVEQILGARP